MLTPEMERAGAQRRSDVAPSCVSKDWLLATCDEQHRILAMQEDERALSEDQAAAIDTARRLAVADISPTGALRLFRLLGHIYMVQHEGLVAGRSPAAVMSAEQATHDLLQRRPVEAVLGNGRRVAVREPAYGAVLLMGAHGARAQMLAADLELCTQRYAEAIGQVRDLWWFSAEARRWRRRMRALERRHSRLSVELAKQRLMMWAHAFTPDGAPHPADKPVPVWLGEITQVDEVNLFEALHEVGPRRIAALIAALPKPKRRRKAAAERPDFGPDGLLAAYGYRLKVPAAECYDKPLGYMTAELLTAMPDVAEELSDL